MGVYVAIKPQTFFKELEGIGVVSRGVRVKVYGWGGGFWARKIEGKRGVEKS